jgi:hypothetical protein
VAAAASRAAASVSAVPVGGRSWRRGPTHRCCAGEGPTHRCCAGEGPTHRRCAAVRQGWRAEALLGRAGARGAAQQRGEGQVRVALLVREERGRRARRYSAGRKREESRSSSIS